MRVRIDAGTWPIERQRAPRPLLDYPNRTRAEAEAAARHLNVHGATVMALGRTRISARLANGGLDLGARGIVPSVPQDVLKINQHATSRRSSNSASRSGQSGVVPVPQLTTISFSTRSMARKAAILVRTSDKCLAATSRTSAQG